MKEGISADDDRVSAIKLKIVKSAVNRTYDDLYYLYCVVKDRNNIYGTKRNETKLLSILAAI